MNGHGQKKTAASRIKFWGLIPLLVLGGAARGDTIELRNAVRLGADDRIVNLGDIAVLEGPDAQKLSEFEITTLDGGAEAVELTIGEIRTRLDGAGVHWGRIQLSGRTVVVRPGRAPGESALMAMQSASLGSALPSDPAHGRTDAASAQELSALPTIRGALASFMAAGLRRPADEIGLAFDVRDDAALNQPRAGHRIEFEPTGSLMSDRLGLRIRLWDGIRVTARYEVTIGLLIRAEAPVPARDIARDERITDEDLHIETMWLKPSEAALAASRHDVVGRIAARRLEAGAPIARAAVRRQTVIQRGDAVIVRCLVGGTVIAVQAEARADGAEGDVIEFRKKGERAVFLATIAGPGEAIVDLSAR